METFTRKKLPERGQCCQDMLRQLRSNCNCIVSGNCCCYQQLRYYCWKPGCFLHFQFRTERYRGRVLRSYWSPTPRLFPRYLPSSTKTISPLIKYPPSQHNQPPKSEIKQQLFSCREKLAKLLLQLHESLTLNWLSF